MDIIKDYRKFALSKGVSSSNLDSQERMIKDSVGTPLIMEERNLNVATYDIFSRLMYDRIIFLSGEVTEDSMDTIVAQMLYLDSVDDKDINLYINSPGGNCYAGMECVSVMDFINSDVSTTVLGMAASMGTVIASNGVKGKRYLLPYSRYMIHQPSSYHGWQRFTDSKIQLEEMENTRNDLYEILSRNSGQEIEKIVDLCEHGDNWLKPQQTIELGFADTIVETKRK